WVYKNHYAGFVVMTCPLMLAQCLFCWPQAHTEGESPREKLLRLLSGTDGGHIFWGFGTMMVIASVFLAQSRGGILSLFAALLCLFLLLTFRRRKMQMLPLLLLLGSLLLAGGWVNWTALLERFHAALDPVAGTFRDDRILIWRDTLRIIADFPVVGTGFGTFFDVFPKYKTLPDELIYDHAHNDYLELLSDSGLIGFLLAAWFVGSVLKQGLRQLVSRHDRLAVLSTIGAFSGTAGLLFFSLTDFNLHNWANGLYFFFLCGLLAVSGRIHPHHRHPAALVIPDTSSAAKKRQIGFFLAAVAFLLAALRLHCGALLSEGSYRWAQSIAEDRLRSDAEKLTEMAELLEQASRHAPWHSGYKHILGNIRGYQGQHGQAAQLYAAAVLLQPLEKEHLRAAAEVKARL
ncbi:O-antigen ligase family protein, partial [Desulfobulbus sp. F4]|nr:O-antigen ligase family protein [Desulfobulbus sp. F4]